MSAIGLFHTHIFVLAAAGYNCVNFEIRGAGPELSKHRRHRDECLFIRHRYDSLVPCCRLAGRSSATPCCGPPPPRLLLVCDSTCSGTAHLHRKICCRAALARSLTPRPMRATATDGAPSARPRRAETRAGVLGEPRPWARPGKDASAAPRVATLARLARTCLPQSALYARMLESGTVVRRVQREGHPFSYRHDAVVSQSHCNQCSLLLVDDQQ